MRKNKIRILHVAQLEKLPRGLYKMMIDKVIINIGSEIAVALFTDIP